MTRDVVALLMLSTGNPLASRLLSMKTMNSLEESVKRIVVRSNGLFSRHGSVRLDTVLQTVELPAGVTDLTSSLSNVN